MFDIERRKDIEELEQTFKLKVKLFLAYLKEEWYNVEVFEAFRTYSRQLFLYSLWRTREWKKVTWTLSSKHLEWKAVDIVLIDDKWNIDWNWNYENLWMIADEFWIDNGYLLWGRDWVHFQDNPSVTFDNNLLSKYINMGLSKYKKIYLEEVSKPLFNEHKWDKPLSEEDVKYLLEIIVHRYDKKLKGEIKDIVKKLKKEGIV